jgi:hypothetical protein
LRPCAPHRNSSALTPPGPWLGPSSQEVDIEKELGLDVANDDHEEEEEEEEEEKPKGAAHGSTWHAFDWGIEAGGPGQRPALA